MRHIKLRLTGDNKPQNDTNIKYELFGWIIQIIGRLILCIIGTILFILIAYISIITNTLAKSWLTILIAVIGIGGSLMGIASIIINTCNIIYLIGELHNKAGKY